MQNNRTSHARRFFIGLGALLALVLGGCQSVVITNLTPNSLPANPSQIYTISARIAPKNVGFVKESVRPNIIIDGQSFLMKKSPLGEDIFEFDYQLAAGRTEVAYYFLVNYQVNNNGLLSSREEFTEPVHATIVSRYVLSLEVVRGPVGARVSVLGRGFTPSDVVYFDNTPVRTVFESANAISFFVPPVEPNRNYRVTLGSSIGASPVGTFRVDGVSNGSEGTAQSFGTAPGITVSPLTASPASLSLKTGEKVSLTFTTPVTAPAGGILIDVTTDIADSVIMPEVIVPAGTNTVTVTVQGGRSGTGSLVARGPGVKELVIPITVK